MANRTNPSYEDLAMWDDLNVIGTVEDDEDDPTHM
jgi:hypothetical protein